MINTLKKLLPLVPSVSGREGGIREIITALMRPLVDDVSVDAMGNLICLKKGSAAAPRKVMLCAHMDEIGFIVNFIEENGYLRVAPIGGIHYAAAAFSEVVFENGARGVLVPEADVPAKETPKAEKCYIDIGAASRKEAERRVRIGDCCALVPHLTKLTANRITGRPFDDRIGCAVMLEIAQRLTAPADDIYYVFSVQEEVGCRGAKPAAFAIAPDLALIYDVTGTGDEQGSKPMAVKLGEGVAVKIKDSSVICDRTLVDELLDAAKEKRIPAQCEILTYGGTDTSSVQMTGLGCRAGALSIPSRYIHSGVEMIDLRDAKAAVDLTLAYLGGAK
ncbi:MAG: M20/M25/M40 family metallo-hydrolase [Clostridia bacterium]|nr:M20/M25/M40 family metallo-hydrolase [Clostridia bacterium]